MNIQTTNLPTVLEMGGLPKEQLIKRVLAAGYKIEVHTLDFIQQNNFPCTTSNKTVKLAYKTATDMGLSEEATYGEIENWVKTNGKLCDKDLALWLRLAYTNQPETEWVAVVSESTPEKLDNDPCTLHVVNFKNDGMSVSYCYLRPDKKPLGKKIYCYVEE